MSNLTFETFTMDTTKRLKAIELSGFESFTVLDQTALPLEKKYVSVSSVKDAYDVIKSMKVRGAPLIATVAVWGLAVQFSDEDADLDTTKKKVHDAIEFLISSRPTAVNMKNVLDEVAKEVSAADSTKTIVERIRFLANRNVFQDEELGNKQMLWNGLRELAPLYETGKKLKVMTICNTGGLATTSWGTALGIIQALHQLGHIEIVYALETRPYLQGMRLTAMELREGGVPFKVITDGMAAYVMLKEQIDCVIVGADQVAANGDTANKIGTYSLAVLSHYHNVKFYTAVPLQTINTKRPDGSSIPIEERPAIEMITINGAAIGHPDTPVFNPAFDVTPTELITRCITDDKDFVPSHMIDS